MSEEFGCGKFIGDCTAVNGRPALAVRYCGIQVSRLVALSPLLPAAGIFRPFELPRRGIGVAGLATPAVLHGQ